MCSPAGRSLGIVTVDVAAPPALAVMPVASTRGVEWTSTRRPDSFAPNPKPLIVTWSPGATCETERSATAGSFGVPEPSVLPDPSPGVVPGFSTAAPTVKVTGSSASPAV
ncbi:hypothetical protein D3C74_356840 [compost metagenome]